jgi:hypothetical protein
LEAGVAQIGGVSLLERGRTWNFNGCWRADSHGQRC